MVIKKNKQTDIVLSSEELAIIENYRKQKQAKERAERLENEFKSVMLSVRPQIEEKLRKANEELLQAVALAEKHGLPFSSKVEGMVRSRTYIPESFKEKWGDLDYIFLDNNNISGNAESGWEYWTASSLSC